MSLGIIPSYSSVVRSFLMPWTHAPFHVPHASAPTLNGFFNFLLIYGIAGLPELGELSWAWNFIGLLGPSPYFHLGYQKA
ncbi:MAG: hypothetical protein ACLS6Y_09375 [Streptococcus salivarius]